MKKGLLLIGILCFMNTSLFGFATLTAPQGGDPIQFSANTTDVAVYLNGQRVGRIGNTPYTFKVKREEEQKIFTFKKSGYSDSTVVLSKAPVAIFWLNFIIGGIWGSSTDSIFTNNNMEYSPNQYFIQMKKL